jgi:hypothetical protein
VCSLLVSAQETDTNTSETNISKEQMIDWRLSDVEFLKAFRLPQKGAGQLKELYKFPREDRITFDEEKHEYTIDGQIAPRSVTKLLHEYASEFDPNRALIAMKNGIDWETKKLEFEETGTSDIEIMKRWELNGEVARARGTLLHYHAEQMMNGEDIEEPYSPEFAQAKMIYGYLVEQGFEPYRAEVNIFHRGLEVAGQPDALMKDKDGQILIVDWKRSKAIKTESRLNLKYPLAHIPDCNYWLYSLQVNLYGYVLETEYNMKIAGYYLVVVHPEMTAGRLIKCPRLHDEMLAIHEYEIECGRASS